MYYAMRQGCDAFAIGNPSPLCSGGEGSMPPPVPNPNPVPGGDASNGPPGASRPPFVSVFDMANKRTVQAGDCEEIIDKTIGKRVFRIRGSVPDVNYLSIAPSVESAPDDLCGLGLTGKNVYLEIKPMPGKAMTFHMDVIATRGRGSTGRESLEAVRLSFSTTCSDHVRGDRVVKVSIKDVMDAAGGKWMLLSINLPRLLTQHHGSRQFSHLRGLRLCSNMLVRGVYTSSDIFTLDNLPKELCVPVFMGRTRSEGYQMVWLAQALPSKEVEDNDSSSSLGLPRDDAQKLPCSPEPRKRLVSRVRVAARTKAKHEFPSSRASPFNRTTSTTCEQIPEGQGALQLERIINYSGGTRTNLTWTAADKKIVYSSHSTVVIIDAPSFPEPLTEHVLPAKGVVTADELAAGATVDKSKPSQTFLCGHSNVITCLETDSKGLLLATGQTGNIAEVRLWDLGRKACVCLVAFRAHQAELITLCFSPDDSLLCTAGHDARRRIQVKIWDVQKLRGLGMQHYTGGQSSRQSLEDMSEGSALLARQTSDFSITRIKFSPFEQGRLVSCGRENVRFWRVKRRHLPACPARLGDFSRQTDFTDLAFETSFGKLDDEESPKVVFVACAGGNVMQVSYTTREVLCVLRLHNDAINCIAVNEGFVVTGSSDRFLRCWPLDFSEYALEAQNESAVSTVAMSTDGIKLVLGTVSGSIGVLDLVSQQYTTVMRSHTSCITSLAADPQRDEFATAGEDGTVRVWDRESGCQRYEFLSPQDVPNCLCYHPFLHIIACGFMSGSLRVLDVPTTSTLQELQQHKGSVTQVIYARDGKRLYSAAACGTICVYDVARAHQPIRVIAVDFKPDSMSIALSSDGSTVAAVCAVPYSLVIFDAETMHVRRHVRKTPPTAMPTTSPADVATPQGSAFREVLFLGEDAYELLGVCPPDRLVYFKLPDPADYEGKETRNPKAPSPRAIAIKLPCGPLQRWLAAKGGRFGFAVGASTIGTDIEGSTSNAIFVWSVQRSGLRDDGVAHEEHDQQQWSVIARGDMEIRGKHEEQTPLIISQCAQAHHGNVKDMVLSADGAHLISADDKGAIIISRVSRGPLPTEGRSRMSTSMPLRCASDKAVTAHADQDRMGQDGDDRAARPTPNKQYVPIRDHSPAWLDSFLHKDSDGGLAFDSARPVAYGYNGHAQNNMVWWHEMGVLIYTVGAHIVVYDLDSNTCWMKHAHIAEISCLANGERHGLFASACESLSATQEVKRGESIKLWQLVEDGGKKALVLLAAVEGPAEGVQALCFSPTARRLAVLGLETNGSSPIVIIDVPTKVAFASWRCDGPLFDAAFLSEDALACGGWGLTVTEVNTEANSITEVLNEGGYVTALAVQGGMLLAGGTEGRLWLISMDTEKRPRVEASWKLKVADGGAGEVVGLVMRGSRAVMGCSDAGVYIWDLLRENGPVLLCTIRLPPEVVPKAMQWDMALEDGLIGASDGTIWYMQLDAESRAIKSQIRLVSSPVGSRLAVSERSGRLSIATTAGGAAGFQLWGRQQRTPLFQDEDMAFESSCLTFLLRRRVLACGCIDGSIRLVDMETGRVTTKSPPAAAAGGAVLDLMEVGGVGCSQEDNVVLSLNEGGCLSCHVIGYDDREGRSTIASKELTTLPHARSLDASVVEPGVLLIVVQSALEALLVEMKILTNNILRADCTIKRLSLEDKGATQYEKSLVPRGLSCQWRVPSCLTVFSAAAGRRTLIWIHNDRDRGHVGSSTSAESIQESVARLVISEPVSCVAVRPACMGGSQYLVAIGTVRGTILIVDEGSWAIVSRIKAHSSCVTDMRWAGTRGAADGTLTSLSSREMFVWHVKELLVSPM